MQDRVAERVQLQLFRVEPTLAEVLAGLPTRRGGSARVEDRRDREVVSELACRAAALAWRGSMCEVGADREQLRQRCESAAAGVREMFPAQADALLAAALRELRGGL